MYQVPASVQSTTYVSQGKKMGFVLIWAFALVFAIIGLIGVVGHLINLDRGRTNWGVFVTMLVFLVGGGFLVWKLFPKLQLLVDYRPRFEFAPNVVGAPFQVQFNDAKFGLKFYQKGTVQFFPDHIFIDGKTYNQWIALVTMVGVMLVTAIVFKGFLGILPAALLAQVVSQGKKVLHVPFQAIQNITVKGNEVAFETPALAIKHIRFYTASVDGARLYAELSQKFPIALNI